MRREKSIGFTKHCREMERREGRERRFEPMQMQFFDKSVYPVHVVSSKTFEVHISEDTVVPQLNFGLRASLPIGYLPTKLLSDRPPRAETLPLSG